MFQTFAKIFSKKSVVFCAVVVFVFLLNFQIALARGYSYDLIKTTISINQDSTFDVEEQQVFQYLGEFHVGWRSVSLNKTDGITDIEVIDGETELPLVYSPKRLDKLNPESWGRYTYYKENGAENIEWYYNLSDTAYRWIIKYKVHGGIGFFNNYDELYWNIFTNYDAAVKEATVQVTLPGEVNYTKVKFDAYRSDPYQAYFMDKSPLPDKKSFLFEAKNFKPKEDFTVKLDWPKGLVSQSAYWQDFLNIYFFYFLAILISLANMIYIAIHWYLVEVRPVGRGTIIPQYAPPENLRPAMAEVLLKEKITDKGWSATVIDLAVRGYIKIKEDTASWTDILGRIFIAVVVVWVSFMLIPLIVESFSQNNFPDIVLFTVLFLIFPFVYFKRLWGQAKNGIKEFFIPKNYILERVDGMDESGLEDYEKRFLKIIFRGSGVFSTKEMKWAGKSKKRELFESMKRLEQSLFKETTIDTGAFRVGVEKEKIGASIFLGFLFAVMVVLAIAKPVLSTELIFVIVLALNAALLYVYLKYEARLSEKGFILKEDWLGFKMYLETAERYRMQNLTPETFEKYLPYAIIFGIEEKWGKAFEALNIQNPSWYGGVYAGSGFHSGGFSQSGGGFSPAGFSASFSSSFSSAFSSAGGAGSSGGGGGGGAGGGGGGGGGGAG